MIKERTCLAKAMLSCQKPISHFRANKIAQLLYCVCGFPFVNIRELTVIKSFFFVKD